MLCRTASRGACRLHHPQCTASFSSVGIYAHRLTAALPSAGHWREVFLFPVNVLLSSGSVLFGLTPSIAPRRRTYLLRSKSVQYIHWGTVEVLYMSKVHIRHLSKRAVTDCVFPHELSSCVLNIMSFFLFYCLNQERIWNLFKNQTHESRRQNV